MAHSYPYRLRLRLERGVMIDRPATHQQLDLLILTANALESSRISQPTRAEVTVLLKLLMSEHIAAGVALPPETANE